MSAVPICVVGALGRMGQRVIALAAEHGCWVAGALVEPGDEAVGERLGALVKEAGEAQDLVVTDDPRQAMAGCKVVIDFALAAGLDARLRAAVGVGATYLCGTTGLDTAEQALFDEAAQKIAVLWAPNMSTGVNLLLALVEQAARVLAEADVEIFEIHHRHKADAPSGTALALAQTVARARGQSEALIDTNRQSQPRRPGEIGVVASRGGEVAGEHTVYLFAEGERLELCHRAANRDIFARGALRAAGILAEKKRGRYDMRQVLGIEAAAPFAATGSES